MKNARTSSKSIPVLFAAALLIVLAGSLGARLIARDAPVQRTDAPPGFVSAPKAAPIHDLEVPCWSCPSAKQWAVRFQTDLDLLAPLGAGAGNAATWFADFAKDVGPRRFEASAARERLIQGPEWIGKVLPADDPLLLEAEPWCDQATMSFYPQHFELDGTDTRITNLVLPLTLVRSWVARGMAAEDPGQAMDDFRRAIRLGRLLRQEDTVVISDLVGLACIHIGAQGVYRRALVDGDLETALTASAILGEVAPQRLRTSELLTRTDLADSLREGKRGVLELELRSGKLEKLIETAEGAADRRFRCEAIVGLNIVRFLGSEAERERAHEVLDALAGDDDPDIAESARWSRDEEPTEEHLKDWMEPPPW
jgi:hypothetical protein